MTISQKGFATPLLIALVAVLLIGGGAYVYVQNKQTSQSAAVSSVTQATSTAQVADCADFGAFSQFVLNNIEKPDSLKEKGGTSIYQAPSYQALLWKRNASEPFITYPAIQSVIASYGGYQASGTPARNDLAAMAALKDASNSLNQNLDKGAASLGLIPDALSTYPFESIDLPAPTTDGPGNYGFVKNWEYDQLFGFRKGNSLYSVVLEGEVGLGGFGQFEVSIICGKPIANYDHAYDVLNFKSDTSVKNKYVNDYVDIMSISPDSKVYQIHGSNNHVDTVNYYFVDGSTTKLVSTGSSIVECAVLEKQKIGKGMACIDVPSYKQRLVTY